MAITFDANRKIFTIHTKQTTYQMQADAKITCFTYTMEHGQKEV